MDIWLTFTMILKKSSELYLFQSFKGDISRHYYYTGIHSKITDRGREGLENRSI